MKSLLEKMMAKEDAKDKTDSGKGRKRAPLTPIQDQTKKVKISSQSPIKNTSTVDHSLKVSQLV